jgi:hypothetical protein
MDYKKRLSELDEQEVQVCIMSLFRAPQDGGHQKRTRDQSISLIQTW